MNLPLYSQKSPTDDSPELTEDRNDVSPLEISSPASCIPLSVALKSLIFPLEAP